MLQVVSSKYTTTENLTNNVPFESLLTFCLKTPASKRDTWQKGIVVAHKKLVQAMNVLEALDSASSTAVPNTQGFSVGQPLCLVQPEILPAYDLLVQASHDCGHAPLLHSICWKDHCANFRISKFLMKLKQKASLPSLWEALAPCIGLHEIYFMAVYIREGLLAERMRPSSAYGPQQMLQTDETLAEYIHFADSMRKPLPRLS